MARTTLRRLVTLPVAVLVAGGALASAPAAQAAPWLDTADVVAVIDTVTKLPDSYQVERMANNVPAVTVGQDTRAGLTRVTEFTDGGVTSDVITADGRGTWTAVEKTPEVNSELDYLGRAGGVRWTFAPDESTTTPAVVDEFAPARVLSTLPADLDYIMVTSYPLMGGASSEYGPFGTQYTFWLDQGVDPVTEEPWASTMSITTHLDGTLWAITDGTDMNDPVSWLYADAAGVAEPAPGSIVVRADLEAAKVAVATARREAVKVAAVANASARAHHRRTTTADLAVAARKRAKGFVSREGLRVATAFTRGAVSVTVTDRRKPRKTVRKVRINNRGIAVA